MKRTLQWKFIRTAMMAVTVLLLVLLGAINLLNWWQVERQTDWMLQVLTQGDAPPVEPKRPEGFLPPLDADDKGAARFFQVFYDGTGQVAYVDVNQIATVTKEEAVDYAAQCQGRDQGTIDRFEFRRVSVPDGQGERILFLDISSSRWSILTVLAISAGMGLLCWLGTLLLVVLLSHRAIAPLARSMEKQRQFVTNAGHEIKTPLAIIQANTDAMELHQGPSKWSQNIRVQTLRLTGLMENLLTLARMDEVKAPPAQRVELSSLAQEVCQSFREGAAQRNIQMEEAIAPDIVLQANREQMVQLLSILLDNGIKYTEPGGKLALSLQKEGKKVRLRVRNGPTQIPEGDLSRMFDRLFRGDRARTQKGGGYGIGLSAAQAIVGAWGGTITATVEGKNTMVFTVAF